MNHARTGFRGRVLRAAMQHPRERRRGRDPADS